MKSLSAVSVARAPAATYSRLVNGAHASGARELIQRLALLALVNGAVFSIAATGRVTVSLVASVTAYWLIVPLIQWGAALALVAIGRDRRLSMTRAMSLFFLGHLPWSVWALGLAATLTILTGVFLDMRIVVATALVPLLWTFLIIRAFCSTVLRMPGLRPWFAATLHQGLVWGVSAWAVWWTSGGWARTPGLPGQ